MLDRLRQLAIFARTVEAGSFRGAAKALGLSPSVVSHHVSKLEESLGVALLYRSTRKISLTEAGERLLASAQDMVAAAESGLDRIQSGSREPVGRLRVTAPAVMAHSGLVDAVAAFSNAHPKVDLDISFTDVQRNIISDGIDLAIRMGWLKDSALMSKKLGSVARILLAARSFLNGRDMPRSPGDLKDWQFMYLSGVGRSFEFTHGTGRKTAFSAKSAVTVDDATALYRLVRAGVGVATLPDFLAFDDLASGNVVHVLPDWQLRPLGVYAVWPPNTPRGSLTSRFVGYLEQVAAQKFVLNGQPK